MSQCVHEFKKNQDGEVLCVLCGDKDDEMESKTQPAEPKKAPVDFWATQTSFE